MKPRHIMILAVAAVLTFGGGDALAQNTDAYNKSSVVHRAGKWYRSDYREAHPRTQGSDSFYKADGMVANPIHPQGKPMQRAHEYREDVYINPGHERELLIPSILNLTTTVYFNYQR